MTSGLTEPVAETVAELRSSPENVLLLAGAGLLVAYASTSLLPLLGGVAFGAAAMTLYRHSLTPVSHAKPNPIDGGSKIQSLVFDKHVFTEGQAVAWAKRHNFTARKVDVTSGSYRLRQAPPGRFARLRTIRLTHGVQAVVGFPS